MARVEMTAKWVENVEPTDRRQEIPDGKERGLYLIVQPQPSGKKSWAVRYRYGGKVLKFTIGTYNKDKNFTLAEARDMAREVKGLRNHPLNPQNPREVQEAGRRKAREVSKPDQNQFRAVVERYLKEHAKKRRSYVEKARLLGLRVEKKRRDLSDVVKGRAVDLWGKRPVQDITRREIKEHLASVRAETPIASNRVFAELRKFFNWCVAEDILEKSPLEGQARPAEESPSGTRTLIKSGIDEHATDDELRWLWQACERYDAAQPGKPGHNWKLRGPFGPFVQMLILTGQRRSELAGMTWQSIDKAKAVWTIPSRSAKNAEPHVVHLSPQALAVLDTVERIESKAGYVFSTKAEKPLSGWDQMKKRLDGLMAECAEAERGEPVSIPAWTLHDIRRTCAAGMQSLGVQREVTEKLLNHTSGSFAGIVGVYQVFAYEKERREALDAWGRRVMQIVGDKRG